MNNWAGARRASVLREGLERLPRALRAGVEFERLPVVLDRQLLLAEREVGFGEAVVDVRGLRVGFDIELEDLDRLLRLLGREQAVAPRVQVGLAGVELRAAAAAAPDLAEAGDGRRDAFLPERP